jgi:TetR/AcrR family transcriptional regulator, transcriptional repressor for nem operon
MTRRNDKKSRLIQAADRLFRQQGVNVTTLANIAALANVPLGNVYYYFKSKESIVAAVIDTHAQRLRQLCGEWDITLSNGKDRLVALIKHQATLGEETVNFGDPLGSLCQELSKQSGDLADYSAQLLRELYNWCQHQFKQTGKSEMDAQKLAVQLLASLQGISILTLSFKDMSLSEQHTQMMLDWVQAA